MLGTRRHAYHARTTMTVTATPHGCLRTRWEVLATRHDAVLACPRSDGAWRLVDQSEEHEFAGHVDRRTYVCTPASTLAARAAHDRCDVDQPLRDRGHHDRRRRHGARPAHAHARRPPHAHAAAAHDAPA